MTPELERAVKRYRQWFGSYKKSGELIKVQVWLTVNNGCIEFLTLDDSYKVKRIRRNPRVICYLGDKEGPQIPGTAEIVMGRSAIWRVYRAYWKTHPLIMALIAFSIRRRIENRKQVLIRVHPDEPNPLAGCDRSSSLIQNFSLPLWKLLYPSFAEPIWVHCRRIELDGQCKRSALQPSAFRNTIPSQETRILGETRRTYRGTDRQKDCALAKRG
jgi:PPOX class probable F420-dependent enzyme